MDTEQPAEPEVNIEEVMQRIRQQILARRSAVAPQEYAGIVVEGKRLPPEFYEYLYQARIALDEVQVPLLVSRSTVPLFGPAIDWLRGKIHELVLFYVNQSAARQVAAVNNLLKAVSALGQELELSAGEAEAPQEQ